MNGASVGNSNGKGEGMKEKTAARAGRASNLAVWGTAFGYELWWFNDTHTPSMKP